MYPNPQDVLPLPPRPDLDQYRKRAKELTAASRAGEAALLSWATQWIEALAKLQPSAVPTTPRELGRRAHQVAQFARERMRQADYSLSQAYFVLARAGASCRRACQRRVRYLRLRLISSRRPASAASI